MKYIEVMAELQLELAGEYLLMAAMLAEIKSRMLLPRPPSAEGQEEEDPRAELVRRLQEYERFKKAAEDIDRLARLERDTMLASVELTERKVVKVLPQVTLQEMLLALKDVLQRAEMFAHHHVARERLSVRQRMSEILSGLQEVAFVEFTGLFRAHEGRMGVTVTFIAILELMKEGLIEIVQAQAYAAIHVRPAAGQRQLKVVDGGAATADAENEAALAQPAHPDENDLDDDEEDEPDGAEDPPEADPPGTDAAGIDPTSVDATGIGPSDTDAAGIDPTGAEAAEIDPSGTDAAGIDPIGADAAGIDPAGTDDPADERAAGGLEISDTASVPSDAGQDGTQQVPGEQITSAAADTMAVVTSPADNAEEQPTADRDSSHE
jgi:chromatin segregation and condensation protein Rec8/ScpA/Scc1 (kleisin family)